MGKLRGFLEIARQAPSRRAPQTRTGDWEEFVYPLDGQSLTQQAGRCMDCGVPFCHTGMILERRVSGCPIHNRIPEFNDRVWRGELRAAWDNLRATNNFPGITGRVCPAPCEGACVVGINAPPVTIKGIEQGLADHAWEQGWTAPMPPARRTGRRVAVVGSGPAGLACADQLNRAGHLVTVYERQDRIGGLLMYGIPNMKLSKALLDRRVGVMADEGITFVTGLEVGPAYPIARIQAEHDAIVLCCGATRARELPIEGRALDGIHLAMDFLTGSTRALLAGEPAHGYISAKDKRVVVIGGGDTGTDCVATALRMGCASVTQLELLDPPPAERAPQNPWPQFPRTDHLDYAQQEAVSRFGADPRRFGLSTRRFLGDPDGRVCGLETVEVSWRGGRPEPVDGTERRWDCDLVLLALGFVGVERTLPEALGLPMGPRGNVQAQFGAFSTDIEGIFCAGDMRRGQSLVVWAIAEGRGAARAADAYLMGSSGLPE